MRKAEYKNINGQKHKKCFKCEEFKPFPVSFYKHKQMGDGTLNKCKKCTKLDSDRNYKRKLETDPNFKEKEKARAREKYHRLYNDGRYNPSYEEKKKIMKKYNEKYPEKVRAKNLSSNLRKDGLEKHHWSYCVGDEKDVIWLTNKDHNFLHRYIQYDQEQMKYRCTRDLEEFISGDLLSTKEEHITYYNLCLNNILR